MQRDAPLSHVRQNGAQMSSLGFSQSGQNPACGTVLSVRSAGEVAGPAQQGCISVLSSSLSSPELVASQRDTGETIPSLLCSSPAPPAHSHLHLSLLPSKLPSCFVLNPPWQQLGCGSFHFLFSSSWSSNLLHFHN